MYPNSMYQSTTMKYEKERRLRRKTAGQRAQERRVRTKEYATRYEPSKREYVRKGKFPQELYNEDDYYGYEE